MSAEREVNRIVRSWLEEGPTVLPERVLDAVLDQVPAIPQRRHSWPAWRLPLMNSEGRIGAAVAAVVVVVLLVVYLLPRFTNVAGPPSTPAPSSAPSPTPTPSPSTPPTLLHYDPNGNAVSLDPGTYLGADPFLVPVTFTVPGGWEGVVAGPNLVALNEQAGWGALNFSVAPALFANPCHYAGLLSPQPGPTVDDLASALARMPGVTTTTPADVTVAGYQGKQLTLTAPTNLYDCKLSPVGSFEIWQLPSGTTSDLAAGEADQVWILDVRGQRVVIDEPESTDEDLADAADVRTVFSSIHFGLPSPGSSAAASPSP